jgi:hypothetical protein
VIKAAFSLLMMFFAVAVSNQAEANQFYSIRAKLELSYSNILTGTEVAIAERWIDIRYQNCMVFKDGIIRPEATVECKSRASVGNITWETPVAAFQFLTDDLMPVNLLASWQRILKSFVAFKFTTSPDRKMAVRVQLHDSEPSESFHLILNFEPARKL